METGSAVAVEKNRGGGGMFCGDSCGGMVLVGRMKRGWANWVMKKGVFYGGSEVGLPGMYYR